MSGAPVSGTTTGDYIAYINANQTNPMNYDDWAKSITNPTTQATTTTPTSAPSTALAQTWPQPTANLGSTLNPKYYDPAIAAALPANLPGGGGGVVDSYGMAPWANAQYGMPAGANPSVNWGGGNNYFNTPAGMYNPYLGQSGVMPAFDPVNNPYGGFNSNINSYATGVDNYLNQMRQPTPQAPVQDTSPGSPFAGQQVVHGNTAGWQSAGGDYVGIPQQSYQAAPGTQTDVGAPQQANRLGRREWFRQRFMNRWQDQPYFQRNNPWFNRSGIFR
jgi:hypothetical protein